MRKLGAGCFSVALLSLLIALDAKAQAPPRTATLTDAHEFKINNEWLSIRRGSTSFR
jgi:hypothetical protein